jgi:hypothetical protein
MEERGKKLKAEIVLEHIVDLKTQQLFGYRVLSRIPMDGEKELRFQEIGDESLRKKSGFKRFEGSGKIFKGQRAFHKYAHIYTDGELTFIRSQFCNLPTC